MSMQRRRTCLACNASLHTRAPARVAFVCLCLTMSGRPECLSAALLSALKVTGGGAAAQWGFLRLGLLRSEKKRLVILNDLSSLLAPGRFTLLLGPPASGKSTLLKLLAGKLQRPEGLDVRAPQPRRVCGAPVRRSPLAGGAVARITRT